jgi:hypothetical protein
MGQSESVLEGQDSLDIGVARCWGSHGRARVRRVCQAGRRLVVRALTADGDA